MIEYIEGKIVHKNPAYVVIDIGGIAYHIKVTIYTYEQLSGKDNCKILTHLVVKEDSHTLYGFFNEEERQLFRSLISVSGIGPGTAILILSFIRTSELRNAIISGDIALLKSIKGVGQKTAQRIVIDLQDSMKKELPEMLVMSSQNRDSFHEAISALVMLGFKKQDAEQVVMKAGKDCAPDITVEEIIKLSLKNLK
jgi:holliday junction DNA helicase RuvA